MARRQSTALARVALMSVAALVAAGCSTRGIAREAEGPPPAVPVRVARAASGEVVQTTVASGSVRPALEVALSARVPGPVAAVHVQMGDRVRPGQVLLEIEGRDLRAQLDRARAAFEQARVAAADADRTLARYEPLFQAGAISQQQIDQARSQAELARARLREAEAAVRAAETAVSYLAVRAPAAGVIADRRVDPGMWVGPGVPLLTLVNTDQVTVDVQVSEIDVARLRPGQEVTVRVPSAGQRLAGILSAVSPSTAPGQKSYLARVEVPNPNGTLRGGMYAEVELVSARTAGVTVPVDAVVERGGQTVVYVVESGTAREKPVEVRARDGERAVVKGIGAGDAVVVSGQQALADGTAVAVTEGGGR